MWLLGLQAVNLAGGSERLCVRRLWNVPLQGLCNALSFRMVLAAGVTVGVAMTIVYRCFVEIWMRWYPAWYDESLTLWGRLGDGGSYYSHGPWVILCSIILAVAIYKQVGLPSDRSWISNAVGWGTLIVFSSVYLSGLVAGINFVAATAMVGAMFSLALVAGGWVMLRAYCQPLGLLAFMIPLPQ